MDDFRYALRGLKSHKTFAATVILTHAVGIGSTTAMFSVLSGVVLRPLPLADPGRLVQVSQSSTLNPRGGEAVAWSALDVFRDESRLFEDLVGYDVSARFLRTADGAERVMTVRAERRFFTMLGVPPLIGRTFRDDDDAAVVVIGEAFWRQRFSGDPSVLGASVTLDDEPVTIIGVMPAAFQFPYGAASILQGVRSETRTDLWTIAIRPANPRVRLSYVTGRLKGTTSPAAAEGELGMIARRLASESPDLYRDRGVRLVPLAEAVVAPAIRRSIVLLFLAVGLALVLACVNISTLALARIARRSGDIAVRMALGANSSRLARLFLFESLTISFAGGALGLWFAWAAARQFMLSFAAQVPRAHEVGVDWRVFLFVLATCTATAVLSGITPAVMATRIDVRTLIQESAGHHTAGRRQRRLRDTLVVCEVALAFVLAMGAALLVRELVRLRDTDAGIDTRYVLTVHLGQRMTPSTDVRRFYEIARRVRELPGVQAAGLTQLLPLQNWGWTTNSTDFTHRAGVPAFPIELRYVTPGYFEALGLRLKRGRLLTDGDTREAPRVIVINETLARRYFGNDDPIGIDTTRGTIVGVVADVRQASLDRPAEPEIYYAIAQNWSQVSELGTSLVVRTHQQPDTLAEAVRGVVKNVDPNLAIFSVKTMDAIVAESLSSFTAALALMTALAVLSLVLAATGASAVIAFAASLRMREFAIRMALGARRANVVSSVVGYGVTLTAIGLTIGLITAIAASPLLRNVPITVRSPDAGTVAPVALLIGAIALVASALPARRAASVDLMSMLRKE